MPVGSWGETLWTVQNRRDAERSRKRDGTIKGLYSFLGYDTKGSNDNRWKDMITTMIDNDNIAERSFRNVSRRKIYQKCAACN